MGNVKGILVLTGAVLAGKYIAERFILRPAGGTSGFVEVSDGFGLDDVVFAATIAGAVILAKKFAG
jgi:hypothetical protein